MHPSTVYRRIFKVEKIVVVDKALAPEVLSICYIISNEATPIWSIEDVFRLAADYHNTHTPNAPAIINGIVKYRMSYSEEDWEGYRKPVSSRESCLAAFIRKVRSDK